MFVVLLRIVFIDRREDTMKSIYFLSFALIIFKNY